MNQLRHALLHVGPHNNAHHVAARAAISVAVPLLVVHAIGHLEWGLYVAFGAFVSLYGRERGGRSRTRLQLTASGFQIGCITLGALIAISDHRAWLAVPASAAVAGITCWESSRTGWHPPGALFQVFAVAAVAAVPATGADVPIAAAVSALTAGFSLLVGAVGSLWRGTWAESNARPIGGTAGGTIPYAALSAVGVLLAGLLSTSIGIGHPYWAMVSAVVPLAAPTWTGQWVRGVLRVVGTGLGLGVAAVLLALEPTGLRLIAVATILQAGAELFIGRNYAVALICVTPLALVMGNLVQAAPVGTVLADRAVETVVGVGIGVAVGALARLRSRVRPVH